MRALLFNLIICLIVFSAQAAEITSLDNSTLSLTSINASNSTFRPVKYCKNGSCELIPSHEILALQAFSEKDLNWQQIFQQCKNYQSLNQLTMWTQIVSSLVVALKPISTLRNLRSAKNLFASWGLFGKVIGHRVVFDSGISIAGQVVYSIPLELMDTGEPYPELTPEDVELVENLMEDVLSESTDVYFLPPNLIEGIVVILKGCTSQIKQEYIANDVHSCLAGCHSAKESNSKKNSLKHSKVPPQPQTYFGNSFTQ